MRFPLAAWVNVGASIALVGLLALGCVAYVSNEQDALAAQQVDHTQVVLLRAQEMLRLLAQADAGHVPSGSATLAAMRPLRSENAIPSRRLAVIEAFVRARLREAGNPSGVSGSEAPVENRSRAAGQLGVASGDSARAATVVLIEYEQARLVSERAAAVASSSVTSRWIGIVEGLALLLGILALVQANRNIRQRQRVLEALRQSEEGYRSLFECSRDALVVVDPSGFRLTAANPAAIRLFRARGEAELLSHSPVDFSLMRRPAGSEHAVRTSAEMADDLPAANPPSEWPLRRLDGDEFPATVVLTPFEWNGTRMLLASLRDVTERQTLERQLRQAQRLEVIGRLAGGVAHDFNNLLTVIEGLTSLCLEETDGNERVRAHLRQIQQADACAVTLTRQLLAFSRGQQASTNVLDMNAGVADLVWMLQRLIGPGINLVTSLTTEDASITMCPGQLEQVLMNLVANARDAVCEGGTIQIETAVVDPVEVGEAVPPTVAHRFVRIRVSDNGTGIPAEAMPRLFEPFFTTKSQGKGTGLGLATVSAIVNRARGAIRVASAPGRTVFSVYLPRTSVLPGRQADILGLVSNRPPQPSAAA